jgi:nucleoside-diphosphate-sugar epimerase
LQHEVIGADIVPGHFTDRVGSIADRAFVRECMSGVGSVFHAATLHKPHIVTHTRQDFVDTNITGTLNLLEESVAASVRSFVYTSRRASSATRLSPPRAVRRRG